MRNRQSIYRWKMEWDPAEDAEVGCRTCDRRAKGDKVEI